MFRPIDPYSWAAASQRIVEEALLNLVHHRARELPRPRDLGVNGLIARAFQACVANRDGCL